MKNMSINRTSKENKRLKCGICKSVVLESIEGTGTHNYAPNRLKLRNYLSFFVIDKYLLIHIIAAGRAKIGFF
jgi:hypothetical protein